jgi:hypothetical protein
VGELAMGGVDLVPLVEQGDGLGDLLSQQPMDRPAEPAPNGRAGQPGSGHQHSWQQGVGRLLRAVRPRPRRNSLIR